MTIILLALGVGAGILSGMAAGGGTILVPGLVLLFGIAQHQAQGAVLAAFLATQSAALVGQWRQGNIRFNLVWWMAIGAAVGALVGAWIAAQTKPSLLRHIFGWYLLALGAVNWLDFRQRDRVRT